MGGETKMDFIVNNIIKKLKHGNKTSILNEEYLHDCLWYSSTDQAYSQRTTSYDSSWLASLTTDTYVALALKSIMKLDSLITYETETACNDAISKLDEESLNICRMDVYRSNGKSLYLSFVERMRNGLAHGTFNKIENRFFIINQHKPKPDAKVNYYLNIIQNDLNCLDSVSRFFADSLTDVVSAKYGCLNSVLNFEFRNTLHYSLTKKCIVIIDDEFHFETEKRVEAIKRLLDKYKTEEDTVVIVSENLGNISEKNLVSESGKIRVIQQSKIIEYFKLEKIKV
jgi:hypothetical protein